MVNSDLPNCVRLLHTIEKQVFDLGLYRVQGTQKRAANSSKNLIKKDKVELEIFELVDLFIRDSSLGLFESRLSVLELLKRSLVIKLAKVEQQPSELELVQVQRYPAAVAPMVMERLEKVINVLHFTLGYYGQFKGKLLRTIARLDAHAREKVKTLIDVSKWTV